MRSFFLSCLCTETLCILLSAISSHTLSVPFAAFVSYIFGVRNVRTDNNKLQCERRVQEKQQRERISFFFVFIAILSFAAAAADAAAVAVCTIRIYRHPYFTLNHSVIRI